MTKHVFIIHGWGATPDMHWFPWLKKQLELRGCIVHALAMPDTKYPTQSAWVGHLQKSIEVVDEHTYFIGHSLGGISILRFLEALPQGARAGGAILVAGFSTPIKYTELNSFFEKPVDYKKIKESVSHLIVIHSDNDPEVPLEQGKIMEEKLGAKLIIVKGAGHFNTRDGIVELPLVIEEFEKME